MHSIADKQREINDRIYPHGTKVLHRFRNCGVGIVQWTNDHYIAVRFENGEDTAYYAEIVTPNGLIPMLENAIILTNGEDPYSVGMKNGMAYALSLITGRVLVVDESLKGEN